VWDTGHQAYVHKMLTGAADFTSLRTAGGLAGYPSREESEHDIVENSHASTALSWAAGLAWPERVDRPPSERRARSRSSVTVRSPAGWPTRR
jgi:1-deoxy-D-xylulose-5-phosphate synthase